MREEHTWDLLPLAARERGGRVFIMSQHVRHINASGAWADVAYMSVTNGITLDDAQRIVSAVNERDAMKKRIAELEAALNKITERLKAGLRYDDYGYPWNVSRACACCDQADDIARAALGVKP